MLMINSITKMVQVRRILKVKDWLDKKHLVELDLISDMEYIQSKNSILTSVFIRNLKLPESIRKTATELQEEIDKFIANKKNKNEY